MKLKVIISRYKLTQLEVSSDLGISFKISFMHVQVFKFALQNARTCHGSSIWLFCSSCLQNVQNGTIPHVKPISIILVNGQT